jgi:hypothetical protein
MEETKKVIRKIVMSVNRETLTFLIVERKIYYTDRKLGMLVRLMPRPKNLINIIYRSRNKIPMFIANLFKFTQEELEEYENAKTIDELAGIVIKDAKKNGCLMVANADMEVDDTHYRKINSAEVVI